MQNKKMDISVPYYEDNSRVSNSAIGYYINNGPKYYYNMLSGKGEKLDFSFLKKGTMIHEYLLQPEEFWKDYVILDFAIPKVKQQKDLLEEYHKLVLLNPLESQDKLKLEAYRKAYNNKKSDEKCIEEAEDLIMLYQDYLQYLDNKDNNKIVISYTDLQTLKKIKENIQNHKKANELLFNLPSTFETHNEFHINWQVDRINNIKCKSLLDRVCFDHVNKKIILIDLKTTVNVYDFKHSIEEYDYYRQIAYYGLAIQWYMQEVLNLNSEEYDFEAYIIAIGKDSENQIRVFNMKNDKILSEKIDLINSTLQKISYHNNINQWDHSVEYYEGDGIEEV
jgi:hypothetical protein